MMRSETPVHSFKAGQRVWLLPSMRMCRVTYLFPSVDRPEPGYIVERYDTGTAFFVEESKLYVTPDDPPEPIEREG